MKHVFNALAKLAAIAAVGLISSCNRAEYAMLPKTTPYHATYGTVVKAAPASATPASQEAPAKTSTAPQVVATAPVLAAPQPANSQPATNARPVAATQSTKAEASAAPRKPSLGQKLATAKVLKQLSKATSKVQLKPRREAASAKRLEGKLRQGIVLLVVGLALEIVGAITSLNIIYILGAIIAIIGVILIILYLLDEL